jgi:ATP-binding cassette, subfamily B, bacterial PglK
MTRHLRILKQLLNARQRRRYAFLQAYFIFAAVVQVASVASIAPFVALLSRPALIHEQPLVSWVYTTFGFTTDRSFLVAFAVMLMVLIIVSNTVPAVMTWLVWSFARRLGAELQADIFRGYMYGDLARLARVNSAQMGRIVIHGVNRLIYMVVQPLLTLISSAFVITLITIALIVYDPIIALSAGCVIAGGYLAVFAAIRKRLTRHGSLAWANWASKQRLLTESIGGLKEIRLAGTGRLYEQRLSDLTNGSLASEAMIGLLEELPRFLLEAIALCALLLLGIVLLIQRDDWTSIVAVLSIYAMAGYRLLPAAQAAFRSAASIKANFDAVNDIKRDLDAGRAIQEEIRAEEVVEFPVDGVLEFRNVSFTYPERTEPVLPQLSFAIPRNAITAIVGSSGAGKSTVADLMMGLLSPTTGEVTVGGISIARSPKSWHRHVSFVSQSVFITDDTIQANIVFGAPEGVDPARVRAAAAMANANTFIDKLPDGYQYIVGEDGSLLSGGQRQRIGIARALYNDADVIVLDEPTSALDSVSEREILATMDALRTTKTIIIITHRLSTLRNADQILLLDAGRLLASGSYAELIQTSAEFRTLVAAETHDEPSVLTEEVHAEMAMPQ